MIQMIFETRENLGQYIHISCMIIIYIYIYIYICTGQGPRPVGPWTLALRYNTRPCPRWTYGLDSDTPSSPI